ncbi:MAG: hypothetical protein LW713_06455 [Acetobacteraceae bacterium]|nr:hypothetical protein [Acetobacteraceae bacterium]
MNAKPSKPPRAPLLGRFLFGALVLLAALVAGQSLFWRWSTGALAEGFSDWVIKHGTGRLALCRAAFHPAAFHRKPRR